MQYVTNQATRIIVKAAGDLAPEAVASMTSDGIDIDDDSLDGVEDAKEALVGTFEEASIDIETYTPTIRADRSWSVSELDLSTSCCPYHSIRDIIVLRRVDRGWLRYLGHWRWWDNISAVPHGSSIASRRERDHS